MAETINASNGVALPIANLAQTLGYNGSNLTSITVVYNGITYIQTLSYTGGLLTDVSQWMPQ